MNPPAQFRTDRTAEPAPLRCACGADWRWQWFTDPRLTAAGVHVCAIGKIKDLFAGRGIAESFPTVSDDEGMTRVDEAMQRHGRGLIFVPASVCTSKCRCGPVD